MGDVYTPLSNTVIIGVSDSVEHGSSHSEAFLNRRPSDESNGKRHTACDECRTRKLKCSGETTGCARCIKQHIQCHYSVQKQMGRPRKKPKTDERANPVQSPQQAEALLSSSLSVSHQHVQNESTTPFEEPHSETPIDPSLAAIDQDRTNFSNICTGPIAQSIRDSRDIDTRDRQLAHHNLNTSVPSIDNSGTSSRGTTYAQYPLDIASWPDFSTLESLPVPIQDSNPTGSSYLSPPYTASVDGTYHDPDVDPAALQALPAVPACPCLPNLYLTLSTLSTSSVYPVTSHTVETLLAAQKTAHSVIYCHVCPQKFQSGSQNLMLSCTLLNVLADHWHRIRRCSPENLKKGFSKADVSASTSGNNSFMSVREGQAWRSFVQALIRAYVFGDKPIPSPPHLPSQTNAYLPNDAENGIAHQNDDTEKTVPNQFILTFLIDAIRRRQRQWHHLDEPTDEFPDRAHCAYPHIYQQHQHDHHDQHRTTNGEKSTENKSIDEQDRNQNDEGHHTLCLMIVKHSMEIVQSLDMDEL